MLSSACLNDLEEAGCIEAGATNQAAIDVWLGKKLWSVVGHKASAVKNLGTPCDIWAEFFADATAQKSVRFLSLLGRGIVAGSNGPHGFISQHHFGHGVA
jgi:hypothetical protein